MPPRGILNPNIEPGESEYSHGKGLLASPTQRGQYSNPIDPEGPWEPDVYVRGKAAMRTNSADPSATADPDYIAPAGSPGNYKYESEWVRE